MVNHANVLVGIGRREEALASYNRALGLKPDLFEGLYNRGNLLLEMKNAEAALTSFDAALAVRQNMAGVWNNRGTALRDMRRLDAALASVTAAVVGVILNLALWFGRPVLWPDSAGLNLFAAATGIAAFIALARFRVGTVWVVFASGAWGLIAGHW